MTGCDTSPWCVRWRTTQTTPSDPGIRVKTRPNGHGNGEDWLSRITTKPLIFMLGTCFVHFERLCKMVKYSLDYLHQNAWWLWSNIFYRLMMFRWASGEDLDGTANSGWPIKKWPGDKYSKSVGSVDSGVSSRELSTAYTRLINVVNSS